MVRAKELGIRTLPNRMMWLLFLCLIRACIAIAWPHKNSPDENETAALAFAWPTGLAHNDIHGDNLMFGSFMDAPEHVLTPVLKLLDFGLAKAYRTEWGPTGEQANIEDIGIMMASIIQLRTHSKYTGEEVDVDLSSIGCYASILSPASGILGDYEYGDPDPYPSIDRDLRLTIAACIASEPRHRPSLADLEKWILYKVHYVVPEHYATAPGGVAWESNIIIRHIIQRCVFDAS
ncbi:hypothetical protein M426DRAFT_242319 [Hypoxylon sp. CI-4A]|nr:hypothetical protein M426DRAFT_242319 [Hypoxylon sp. CI-4A]